MLPTNRISTHPGIILLQEFIEPAGLTQAKVAKTLKISTNRLNGLVRGRRGVTPDTAWKLSALFNTSPEFWMNLQTAFDLTKARPRRRVPTMHLTALSFLIVNQLSCRASPTLQTPGLPASTTKL